MFPVRASIRYARWKFRQVHGAKCGWHSRRGALVHGRGSFGEPRLNARLSGKSAPFFVNSQFAGETKGTSNPNLSSALVCALPHLQGLWPAHHRGWRRTAKRFRKTCPVHLLCGMMALLRACYRQSTTPSARSDISVTQFRRTAGVWTNSSRADQVNNPSEVFSRAGVLAGFDEGVRKQPRWSAAARKAGAK